MPSKTSLPVRFDAKDIISAQRLRFIKSSRLKVLVGLWLALSLFLLVQLVVPDFIPAVHFATWYMLIGLALAFLLVLVIFYWVAPWLDYTQNPVWQTPFTLRLTNEQLLISVEGKARATTVQWSRIQKLHENSVPISLSGKRGELLILPKAVLKAGAREKMVQMLKTHSGLSERDRQRIKVRDENERNTICFRARAGHLAPDAHLGNDELQPGGRAAAPAPRRLVPARAESRVGQRTLADFRFAAAQRLERGHQFCVPG